MRLKSPSSIPASSEGRRKGSATGGHTRCQKTKFLRTWESAMKQRDGCSSIIGPENEEHPSRCFMALSQVRRNFVFWHLVCPPVAEPFLLHSDEAGIDEGLLSLIDGTHQENGLVRA